MTVRLVVLWMFLGVLAAFGLYAVKYRVQAIRVEVARAETQLREEKKNLHVLAAEWTYLNRPERLSQLSARYLANNKPVHAQQLADFATLPYPGVAPAVQPAADTQETPPLPVHLGKGVRLASGVIRAR